MELLITGMYWLKNEEAQLASPAEEKERTGKKARHKHMNERGPHSSYQSSSCVMQKCVEVDPFCNTALP
eukprot:4795900-Karenia_brevis.AAC.1